MSSYEHLQLPWNETLRTLSSWIPAFAAIEKPSQLDYNALSTIMEKMPGGFQPFAQGLPLDEDALFIDSALSSCPRRPSEVIVIPDCGMVSRLPFKMPPSELYPFIAEFTCIDGTHCMGLLDGASDILFAFDTGEMLLIDHDERVWFSPSVSTTSLTSPEQTHLAHTPPSSGKPC